MAGFMIHIGGIVGEKKQSTYRVHIVNLVLLGQFSYTSILKRLSQEQPETHDNKID
jgi:hypothetical protein